VEHSDEHVERSDEHDRAPACGNHAGPPVWIRRALVVVGCGVLTMSVAACESTEQESAKIAREEARPAVSRQAHKRAHDHSSSSGGRAGAHAHDARSLKPRARAGAHK
jgi:hypothetical protein